MAVKKTLPWAITDASVIVDRTGRAILHSSLRDERPGERVAIARLAATAPDLLAACEAAKIVLGNLIDSQGTVKRCAEAWDAWGIANQIAAAIAKARGES